MPTRSLQYFYLTCYTG